MNVTKSQVTKLYIRRDKFYDPIQVFIEDAGPGQGQITINVTGDCYGYYWGAMGNDQTMAQFFCQCDAPYLTKKLLPYNRHTEFDPEGTCRNVRREIIEARLINKDIDKDTARDMWDASSSIKDFDTHHELEEWLNNNDDSGFLLDTDWWELIANKKTSEYRTLCDYVVPTIKEALKHEGMV